MTDQEKIKYYEDILNEIRKLANNIPPYYAYGDNEAGCYMADMLESIAGLVRTAEELS